VEVKNLVKLNKRINEKDKLLSKDIIVAYLKSCKEEISLKDIDKLFDQLETFYEDENFDTLYMPMWMLARCYTNLKENKKAKTLQEMLKKQIKLDSGACSNPKDQNRYINNGLHQQITAPLRAYSIEHQKAQDNCPGCGQQIQPGFSFCPGCGSKV
jgi:hypothetical protein